MTLKFIRNHARAIIATREQQHKEQMLQTIEQQIELQVELLHRQLILVMTAAVR